MEVQIFENVQFGQLRGMNLNGEAWLMGTDVARRLGYTNPQKAVRDHVDDEDKRTERIVHPHGGAQQTLVINESGLYSLILSSKLPQAREFKHWVTSEVLPQIRQTGGYIPIGNDNPNPNLNPNFPADESTIMARALLIAQKTIELKNLQLQEQKPMVQFANALVASDSSILIGDLAKLITQNGFEIGRTRLFQWLRRKGYLFQHENRPIQKYVEQGLFELNVTLIETHHGMKESFTTKVTAKGQQYFINLFIK